METAVSNRNKKIGIIILIAPIAIIIFTLFSFALVNTLFGVASPIGATANDQITLLLTFANFVLGLVGLVAVIGLIIGIPLGICFLVKKAPLEHGYDKRSGNGDQSEVPQEIQGWNWGAAGLTWIWGIYYNVWISLLVFLPIVPLFFWIILGIKGNEWAWRKHRWTSVEQFQRSQKKWMPWGLGFFILQFVLPVLAILTVAFLPLLMGNTSTPLSTKNELIYNQQMISGDKVNYSIQYDANQWTVKENTDGDQKYNFTHKNGDLYAFVIEERAEIPLNPLKQAVLTNARSVDPNLQVISEEEKLINGKEFLIIKMQVTGEGIPFIFYGYYYGGPEGTIQFVTFTTPNLLSRYELELTSLLNGLRIGS